MNDMTNNNELKSIMDIKKNSEAFKKATQNITKELPKPEKGGLMAAPQPEQEEAI